VVVAYHLLYQVLASDAQLHPMADTPASEWPGEADTPVSGSGHTGHTGQAQRAAGRPAPSPTSGAGSQTASSPPPGSGDSGHLYGK